MNGHFLPLHTLCHFYLLRKVVFLMCSSGFDAKPVAQNACLPLLCRKHRRVLRFRVGSVDPSHREAGRCTSLWIGSSHSLWKQILRRRRTTVQVDIAPSHEWNATSVSKRLLSFAGMLTAMTRRPTLGPLAHPSATTELLTVSSTARAAQNQEEDHQEKAQFSLWEGQPSQRPTPFAVKVWGQWKLNTSHRTWAKMELTHLNGR